MPMVRTVFAATTELFLPKSARRAMTPELVCPFKRAAKGPYTSVT